jgi:hypothetical protein
MTRPQGPISLWLAPCCGRRTTALFLFGLVDGTPRLTTGCSTCLNLHYAVRGTSKTRKKVLRSLLDLGPSDKLPRFPLVADVVTFDLKALGRRFQNLAPQVDSGLALAVTV